MNHTFPEHKHKRFERVICSLCTVIENRVRTNLANKWSEYSLRRELVACILGSQVRHEMATIGLNRIEQAGLLEDKWWCNEKGDFERKVFNVLSGRTRRDKRDWCYRFPKSRSAQLSKARTVLVRKPLTTRISVVSCPKQIRQSLVSDIAGVGPKQASMFLRNIGKSYELAILDTHVLRFLDMQHLLQSGNTRISTISAYERIERVVANYADRLGFRVGLLDWAIWATMRAAWELGL